MDLLKDSVRPLYFRYLAAAFGSALITSVYSVVDMAVVAPVWNAVYSLGLLMGIGGSVLLSTLRGESEENLKKIQRILHGGGHRRVHTGAAHLDRADFL